MVALSRVWSEPIVLERTREGWEVTANGATLTFGRRRDARLWRKTLYRKLRKSPVLLLAEILR